MIGGTELRIWGPLAHRGGYVMNLLEVWARRKKDDARGGDDVESNCTRIREWMACWGYKRGDFGPAEKVIRFRLRGRN